jgi:hypothetical protein
MIKQLLSCAFLLVATLPSSSAVAIGTLYAAANGNPLHTIDQDTGDWTNIGSQPGRFLYSLTSDWRASSFRLWGIDGTANQLLRLDPNTGLNTSSVPLAADLNGIAYDVTTDQLYGVELDKLYRVDSNTGALTLVGTLENQVTTIAFDNSGNLWCATWAEFAGPVLSRIDKATGVITQGFTTPEIVHSFAFRPADNVVFAGVGSGPMELYRFNPATGARTNLGILKPFGYYAYGLAFSEVPEPNVLPFAILALALRRKIRK